MITRFPHRPFVLCMVTWACILALGADFANLDDLLTSRTVLHDDQDMLGTDTGATTTRGSAFTVPTATSPRIPVFALIDQDSPSSVPEVDAITTIVGRLSPISTPFTRTLPLSVEALYLKHQRLLI